MAILIDELFGRLGYKYDSRGMQRFERGIASARARLDSMAAKAAVVGAAVTGALGFVGNTILKFERKQNALSSVLLKATDEELARLRSQALMLGSTTPKSASEATDAQTELARSGLAVNEVLAATPAVLNTAIAGNLDMATSAKLVAGALRGYGWDAKKADRMSDILASTTANSAFSMNELSTAMTPIAPLARKAKLPFENMMAALGVLRTRQFRPEMAGTALRNIIAILNEKPSPKVEEGFTSLGLTWAGVKKEFEDTKDIIGVLGTLRSAGLDLDTGLAIFGREAGPAALALSDATIAGHDLEKVLKASVGTADTMRKKMSRGLPGAVDSLKSAFEGLQLVLGNAGLTGALENLALMMTDVAKAIASASPEVQMLLVGALLLGPALLAVGAALKGISFALGGLLLVVRVVRGAMLAFGLILLVNPIFLFIAGIALLAAGLLALIFYWDDLTAAIRNAWAWLKVNYPGVFQWVEDAWDAALRWIGTAVPATWEWLKAGGPAVFKWVGDAWSAVLGKIGTAAEIATWVASVYANMTSAVASVDWGALGKTIGEGIREGIIWTAQQLAALIAPDFKQAAEDGIVAVMLAVAVGVGSLLLAVIKGALSLTLGFIDGLFKTDLQAKFEAAWDGVVAWLKDFDLLESGKAIMQSMLAGIVAVKDDIKAKIKESLGWIADYLPDSDAKVGPLSRLTASGKAIIDTLAEGMRQAQPLRAALTAGVLALPPTADLIGPLRVAPPVAQQSAFGGERGPTTIAINFGQGAIVIQAPGGDPREIAAALGGEVLRETMRALAEEMDSVVEA